MLREEARGEIEREARECETEQAAEYGEEHGFGEDVAQNGGAAGAERVANGDLFAAG